MKFIGNFFWFLLTGLYSSIVWLLLGIVWCITIIGIPFGKQCFKLAKLAAFPFGAKILSAAEVKAANAPAPATKA